MHRYAWLNQVELDLWDNVLPFYRHYAPDLDGGGFVGGLDGHLTRLDIPKSLVLTARMLWTHSRAFRARRLAQDRAIAEHALTALDQLFRDRQHGGFLREVGNAQPPSSPERKFIYGHAFVLYGTSECAHSLGSDLALSLADEAFHFLEKARDPVHGGYFEACSEDWSTPLPCRTHRTGLEFWKSHNTQLHVLEALSTYLSVRPSPLVAERHSELTQLSMTQMLHPATGHFGEQFLADWTPTSADVSYGHDIEAAWLGCEAAELTGDHALLQQARDLASRISGRVLHTAVRPSGQVAHHGNISGPVDLRSVWWVQAEALVGFCEAYTASGDQRFLDATEKLWNFIWTHHVDRERGDWHRNLGEDGNPNAHVLKIGPWECPYHHARAEFELLGRLSPMKS